MSTSVMEPGTRLAGRFRLEDRVSESGGSVLWKATDEILARAVAVRTFEPGFPRVDEVVTAARASARLTDPRLTQVFDADDSGERAYVVSEWVVGDTLEDVLTEGALDPSRATALIAEAAEAIASAHVSGLAHLSLTPANLVWTRGATVKVTGLAVNAALTGAASDDPPLTDTRGLGRLLYSALTGHWPGPVSVETSLPMAPEEEGVPYAPAQVRAGIPQELDSLTRQALDIRLEPGDESFQNPAELASALTAIRSAPLPFSGSLLRPTEEDDAWWKGERKEVAEDPAPQTHATPTLPIADRAPAANAGPPPRHRHGAPRQQRPQNKKAIAAVGSGFACVVLAVGGWQLMKDDQPGDANVAPTPKRSSPAAASLDPKSARVLDPRGRDSTAARDTGNAIDGNPRSLWKTQHYFGADFGRLQKGIGLSLDMGKQATIRSVKVTVPGDSGGSLELHVGDNPGMSAPMVAARKGGAVGTFELKPGSPAKGRYVILWFTKLPQANGVFRAQVSNVVVNGAG